MAGYWISKENTQNNMKVLHVSVPSEITRKGMQKGQQDSFPTTADHADILGDMDLDFDNLYFGYLFGFPYSKAPGFPDEHFVVNICGKHFAVNI